MQRELEDKTTPEEREFWRKISEAYTLGEGVKDSSSLKRRAAFKWILCLDAAIQEVTIGRGIMFWSQLPPHASITNDRLKERANPSDVVGISSDCGPDGYCARWFLLNCMKVLPIVFDDPCHNVMSDELHIMNIHTLERFLVEWAKMWLMREKVEANKSQVF